MKPFDYISLYLLVIILCVTSVNMAYRFYF